MHNYESLMKIKLKILCLALFLVLANAVVATLHAQHAEVIQKIDTYLRAKLASSAVPGFAIGIVRRDSVLFLRGYGNTSDGLPVTTTTPFAVASLSKAFTAAAVLQLAEKGLLDLDRPVHSYLPLFAINNPRGNAITVRQLLNQTSGLADTGFPEMSFYHQPQTTHQAIDRLRSATLVTKPGDQFHYHNPNYQILAAIVETVGRERFDIYLQRHLFEPMAMRHTREHILTQHFQTTTGPSASGHLYLLGRPVPSSEPDWFVGGAAGAISDVTDMSQWLRLQMNEQMPEDSHIIHRQSMKLMQTPPPTGASRYGMGWFSQPNGDLYHSGILWTYSAEQMILKKQGYGVVILFNGGLNPFVDYHAFIGGVASILADEMPVHPTFPDWGVPIGVSLTLMILTGLSLRQLSKANLTNFSAGRPKWRVAINICTRLIPIGLLLLLPYLLTLLSGRVLNWERIFLMMPDILFFFCLFALANIAVAAARLKRLNNLKMKRKQNIYTPG
jgi:CubicO group peptidase (beta-lactamase class C family)